MSLQAIFIDLIAVAEQTWYGSSDAVMTFLIGLS